MMSDIPNIDDVVHDLSVAVDDMDWIDGAVCCFDADFPVINESAPKGDRPYLLFYKGDLSLLSGFKSQCGGHRLYNAERGHHCS